jgi:hypothetical protein
MSGTGKRLGDAIRKVVDEAVRQGDKAGGKNVVVAKNVGGSGKVHAVSSRQRVIHRNGRTEVEEEHVERREG